MAFDGSEATWTSLDADRELARNALRVLEGMAPCRDDADGIHRAAGYLRQAIQGLSETLGADWPR